MGYKILRVAPEGLTTGFPKASVPQIQLSRLKIALVPKNKNLKQVNLDEVLDDLCKRQNAFFISDLTSNKYLREYQPQFFYI